MRIPPRIASTIGLLLITSVPPAAAGKPIEPRGEAKPAPVLADLRFEEPLDWYYLSDVGLLLVSGDRAIRAVDLLAPEFTVRPVVEVPHLSKADTAIPVAGTGLLLVPRAKGSEHSEQACAIDTLTGRILWKTDPLPVPNAVFSFPDAGFAVLRSFEEDGHVLAVDLRDGRRLWDLAERPTIIWTAGAQVRFLAGSDLVTVDARSGVVLRRDAMEIPPKTHLLAFEHEDVILFRKNKHIDGWSLPPAPPAESAPARKLWSFDAAGKVLDRCIKIGVCTIDRVGDDLLMVNSSGHHELIRATTGERLLDVKNAIYPRQVGISPDGRRVAVAAKNRLEFHDLASKRLSGTAEYPRGDEGMKSGKILRWIGDDAVMTIYPGKRGSPRKMSAFAADSGELKWTFVLPDLADFELTAEQRAQLVGRWLYTLVAGVALTAANPSSTFGMKQIVVVPMNFDVSRNLDAGGALRRPGASAESGGAEHVFNEAMKRRARVAELEGQVERRSYFVIGDRDDYQVLRIDLEAGGVERAVRLQAERVHLIAPLKAFGVGLTLEENNRRLRLIGLRAAQ